MTRLLLQVPKRSWWTPSQAQFKDASGNENQTRFSLTMRLNDGHIAWRGWFDDRDDADAFLWAMATGNLRRDRELWDLPVPAWRPDIAGGADLSYEFVTTVFVISGVTWTVPADCFGVSGLSGEFIDAVGAGGSGGASLVTQPVTGAGGGAWSRITSLALTPSTSVTIQIGAGGTGVTTGGAGVAGNDGTDTWFNGANIGASSVGAKGGVKGATAAGAVNGGLGGASASGTGTSKNSGGNGGNATANALIATGGGGAAGFDGVGGSGGNTASGVTAGGTGDNGLDGAGRAGVSAGAGASSAAGGNGTKYDATHGFGGGSGGTSGTSSSYTSGAGGRYGGASGACTGHPSNLSGNGHQGLIVVAYTPSVATGGNKGFNMPMLGM